MSTKSTYYLSTITLWELLSFLTVNEYVSVKYVMQSHGL